MKKVVSESEVAHLWAHQTQTEARTAHGNFYFDGDTIYSYGGHYPIAKHYKGIVLLTLRSYSNTTGGHINTVRSAISHKDKVYCYDIPFNRNSKTTHLANINQWFKEIQKNIEKLKTARKPEIYAHQIEVIIGQIAAYKLLFPVKLTTAQKTLLKVSDTTELKQLAVKQAKQEDNYKARIETNGQKIYAEGVKQWRNYNFDDWHFNLSPLNKRFLSDYTRLQKDSSNTSLRSNGKEVETSKGVKIPVEVAHRFYKWYMKTVSAGGCEGCQQKIISYDVNKATADGLTIGCHLIPRAEIDTIAARFKWVA